MPNNLFDSLLDLVKSRRMCRDFSGTFLDLKAITEALRFARFAPKAGKTEGCGFIIVTRDDALNKFFSITCDAKWLATRESKKITSAKAIAIPIYSKQKYANRYLMSDKHFDVNSWPIPYWLVDASFMTMLFLLGLEATNQKALFFWLRHNHDKIVKELDVPVEFEPLGAIGIGANAPGPNLSQVSYKQNNVFFR